MIIIFLKNPFGQIIVLVFLSNRKLEGYILITINISFYINEADLRTYY